MAASAAYRRPHRTPPVLRYTSSGIIFLLIAHFMLLLIINPTRVSPQVSTYAMRKLAHSTNQFGLDLLRAMDRSDPNMAFCPFCVSSSLAMLLVGSDGTTMSSSLRHALYLWGMQPAEVNLAYHDLMSHLGVNLPSAVRYRRVGLLSNDAASLLLNGTGNDLVVLNNIYIQRDIPVNYHYHIMMQRFYKAAIHPLDFYWNGEETRQHINAVVEHQTAGKVREILPTTPHPLTQLLLVSALYFKGTLDLSMSPLGKNSIVKDHADGQQPKEQLLGVKEEPPMYTHFGETSQFVEARRARIRHGTHPYLNCTAIEMPFKGGLISLLILMPDDTHGLETLLTKLSAQLLSDVIHHLEVKRVTLKMPRLSFDKSHTNLSLAFANMGLEELFRPGYAGLSQISPYKWLAVSDIIHKTSLDIKEIETSGENSSPRFISFIKPAQHHVQQQYNRYPPPTQPYPNSPQQQHVMPPIGHKPIFSPPPHPHLSTNAIVTGPVAGPKNKPPPPPPGGQLAVSASNAVPVNVTTTPPPQLQPPSQFPHLPSVVLERDKDDSLPVAVDKPFLYFILDNISGLVMVMGKMGREPANYRLPI